MTVSLPRHRLRAVAQQTLARSRGLGRLSVWLVLVGFLAQGFSLVQQASHLFSPAPGERPFVVAVIVLVVAIGVVGVVAGAIAACSPAGRRTGVFGASLGLAMLVLFAAASTFMWRLLEVL